MFLNEAIIMVDNKKEYDGYYRFENKIDKGTIKYTNGDIYEGDISGNKREGIGRMKRKDGIIYDGVFSNDTLIHLIKLIFLNGDQYFGEFIIENNDNIIPHGKGVLMYKNGKIISRIFDRGQISHLIKIEKGQNSVNIMKNDTLLTHQNIQKFALIDGSIFEGKLDENGDGNGKISFPGGKASFEGDFFGYFAHGKGKHVEENGDVYEGSFREGDREGNGRIYYSNGDQFIGCFKHNLKNGKGNIYFNNGNIFEGFFVDDKPNSFCKLRIKNGDEYKTNYEKGVKQGKETIIKNDGTIIENEYKNGIILTQKSVHEEDINNINEKKTNE